MKTYSLKILATLLVMWHYSVFAQTEIFNSLNVEDGLAQSQVHCILQDNRGYVWFGTDGGGACRYDGKSFVTLNATNGLPSDKILSFAKDKQGNIWIGTERGIAVYNGHKLISLPSDFKRTNDQRIYGIVCGDNDSIWFATSDYVSVWNGRSLQKIDSTEGLIRCVFRDSRGSIWAGTYNKGLYKITGTHVKKYTMANGLSAGSVESIAEPVKGELWLCNNEGIDIFHTDDDKIETIPEMKGKVTKFIFNDNKNVWILTEGPDVYHFSGHNFRQLINKQTMSKEIWSVLKDREGNLWFGSNGAGVIKQQSTPFLILTNKDGLCGELVLSMLHDRKGNEWYGTEKGITQIVKDKATGEKHANYFFKEGRTWALLEDKKGNIWFSTTEHGVYKYDGHVLKNYSDKDLGGHYVRSLLEDDQGNIWIGVNTGLVKFDGKNFKIYKKEDGILSMAIASTKDHKGDLWFATGAGLFKYNNLSDKFIGFTNADGLSNDALMGITEDSDGNIWCGGFKGISKVDFNNRTCKNISISEGLTSNSVYVLASDNLGYIYVGTNQGIDRVNANLYNRTGDLKIKHYGKEEGFIGLECNTNSYLNAKDGSIWFGSINGAARLDPARLQPNNAPPLLYITGINLFFDPFDWTNFSQGTDPESALPVRLALPYNKNHLTFNCIALSLTIPEKTLYSFKMVGFDKTWSPPNKQSYVTYSYLPPGNYTFEVRAMNSDGVWAKKPARFSFTIDPPFWQTWWFYLLSAIFFVLVSFVFLKVRFNALKKRAKELQRQVTIKTRELKKEKEIVELQNTTIIDSIDYAKTIQEAILPSPKAIEMLFPRSFILYKPKAIVSGDFYWIGKQDLKIICAAADCTGHGVPGAFMSLLSNNILENVVQKKLNTSPSSILDSLNEEMISTMAKGIERSSVKNGMDIALIVIDPATNTLEYAGAHNSLYLVRDGVLSEIKADKFSIGSLNKGEPLRFTNHSIDLQQNDLIYLFSDGFADQIGGPNRKKFYYQTFKDLLISICKLDMKEQKRCLDETIVNWKSDYDQTDDILVIGIKI